MLLRRLFPTAALICCFAYGQADRTPPSNVAGIPVNYDESLAGNYTLPDPLVLSNGKPVKDAKTWTEKRRPEIVKLFEEDQYGRAPSRPSAEHFVVSESAAPAL